MTNEQPPPNAIYVQWGRFKAGAFGVPAIVALTFVAALAVANMFAELRKYRLSFTVAHQYLHQLENDVRHAVLGNAGTMISFRLGAEDAPFLAREFQARFAELDLMQLENYHIYLKLMIDGMPSKPFSAATLRPRDGNCQPPREWPLPPPHQGN
jgi:hypothetical protein